MDQPTGRAIAIVIEAPNLPHDRRFAVPVVAKLLRLMADGIERDEGYPFAPEPAEPEGWQKLTGMKEFDLCTDSTFPETRAAYAGVRLEWRVQDDAAELDDPVVAQAQDQLPKYHNPTDEELASLEPAERAAMRWDVTRDDFFWQFLSPDGATHVSVCYGDGEGQAATLDDAIHSAVVHMRMARIIGENEKISVNFGEKQ
jgi:hypothetical protein